MKACLGILASIVFATSSACSSPSKNDFAGACYKDPLPSVPPSAANRTVPWGSPSMKNGSQTCCSSLDEVRAGIDKVDAELLKLLSQRYERHLNLSIHRDTIDVSRAAYVREATRFKPTHDAVDVPSRDQEVIDSAVANASAVHLPQIIAKQVFTAIINSSVPFEYCVVSDIFP